MAWEGRLGLYRIEMEKRREAALTNVEVEIERLRMLQEKVAQDVVARRAQQMQVCAANLRRIHERLVRSRADHNGQLPDWLSEMAPNYITSDTLLCPSDRQGGFSLTNRDPKMPCSYCYELSPAPLAEKYHKDLGKTYREWKEKQLKEFGDVVPVARCMHHSQAPSHVRVLSLSYGGKMFLSPLVWENASREDLPTIAVLPTDSAAGGPKPGTGPP